MTNQQLVAMEQALEALEKSCPAIPRDFPAHGEAITALRTAIEQAEKQEPVAWRHDMGEENGGWEYFEEASCPECQPLYTSPQPSKPWVGLSTDEIYDMYNEPRSDAEMVEFARAIETKLKEKNT